MPSFEKLRVNLARSESTPLLDQAGDADEHRSRTEYLAAAFSESRKFLRNDVLHTFHPIEAPDGFAAGFFAKEHNVPLRHENLEPYVAENYEPALFIISLDRSQVVWMQNSAVGSPKPVLEAFFNHLLKRTPLKDWRAFISQFERTADYWEAVREYRQQITKVTFRFVPPNALEGFESAQKFYTALQKEADSEMLEETLKAKPGRLKLEGPLMRASADLAEQGAGERELRGAKNKLIYTSETGRVSETVAEEDMPTVQSPSFVRRVIERLFGRSRDAESNVHRANNRTRGVSVVYAAAYPADGIRRTSALPITLVLGGCHNCAPVVAFTLVQPLLRGAR